jgi:hypothetical protein
MSIKFIACCTLSSLEGSYHGIPLVDICQKFSPSFWMLNFIAVVPF